MKPPPVSGHPRPSAFRVRKALSAFVVSVLAGASCSSGASAPTAPSALGPAAPAAAIPPATGTITITSIGVSPAEITIAVGGRVTFTNNDVIPHDIAGGPDPANPDCLEINEVGFLAPGQSRATAPFPAPRACAYHDHAHSAHVTGRIVIR